MASPKTVVASPMPWYDLLLHGTQNTRVSGLTVGNT